MSLPSFDLTGRVALVTGSGRGIGLAHRARPRRRRRADRAQRPRRQPARGGRGDARAAGAAEPALAAFDVTDPEAVTAGVATIERDVGADRHPRQQRRHPAPRPARGFRGRRLDRVLRTNLDSAFFVGQAVAARMIPRGRGAIINICSVQSELARPGIAPYTASKGGLKMLTKGMAADWGRHGIRVNGIGPGYFATELNAALVADEAFSRWLANRTPLGRWGEVDDLAGAAVFLASDAASFVNGHILYVDGGMTSVEPGGGAQAQILAPGRGDDLYADRQRAGAEDRHGATGRPMQEKGWASRPRLGRDRQARPSSSKRLLPVSGARAGRRGGDQQVDLAEDGEHLLEPPAPVALRPRDPGGGQQRAGEEPVARVGIVVLGRARSRGRWKAALSELVMR